MRIHKKHAVLMLLFVIVFTQVSKADFERVLNYQGRLTDSNGVPIPDGGSPYDMTFDICTDSTCSTVVWTEAHTGANAVPVSDGLFSVILGTIAAGGLNVDFDDTDYYLQVTVDVTTYSPPHRITASAMSLNSDLLDGLDSTDFMTSAADDWVDEAGDTMSGDLTMADNNILDVNTMQLNTLTDPEDTEIVVTESLQIRGNSGNAPHLTGTSNEESLRLTGSTSDYIIATQDGSGRIQHYWNSTTASTNNVYLVSSENAWFWDITVASDPYMEFKFASAGTAGNTITWTKHMTFHTNGDIDIDTGDLTVAGTIYGDIDNGEICEVSATITIGSAPVTTTCSTGYCISSIMDASTGNVMASQDYSTDGVPRFTSARIICCKCNL